MEGETRRDPPSLPVGTEIGVYSIRDVLGADWLGISYRAWNDHLQGYVFLKEYFPRELASRGEDERSVAPASQGDRENYLFGLGRFLEQADRLLEIEHPSIAGVHTAVQANGTAYLAMDYVRGKSLADRCDARQPAIRAEELRAAATRILDALDQVHERGQVHGALNPDAVLIRRDGRPVLTHFGQAELALAQRMGALPQVLREGYAAAEQYDSGGECGPWTDLYSLGAALYRCVSGRSPSPAAERLAATRSGAPDPQPPAVELGGSDYSEAMLKAVDWMMSPEPRARPQSVAEILPAFRDKTKVEAGRRRIAGPAPEPGSASLPSPAPPWLQIGLVVAVLIVALAGSGFWFLKMREPGSAAPAVSGRSAAEGTVVARDAALTPPGQAQGATVGTAPAGVSSSASSPIEEPAARLAEPLPPAESPAAEGGIGSVPPAAPPLPEAAFPEAAPEFGPAPSASTETARPEAVHRGVESKSEAAPRTATVGEEASAPIVESRSEIEALPNTTPAGAAGALPVPEGSGPAPRAGGALDESVAPPQEPPAPRPAEPPTPPSPARDPIIERHLAAAAEGLAALRLTTPTGNNAFEHYRAVLERAPENPQALAGLEAIVTRYESLVRKAIDKGDRALARRFLDRAERVLPSAPQLENLRRTVDEADAAGQGQRRR